MIFFRRLIFFSILIWCVGCNQPCTVGESTVFKIVDNPVIQSYQGIRIVPYLRRKNTTAYSTHNDKTVYLIDNKTGELVNNKDVELKSNALATMVSQIKGLNDLGIVALVSDDQKTLIYTHFQDSTYDELKKSDIDYFDKAYKEGDSIYKYVLLNIHTSDSLRDLVVAPYDRVTSLRQIKNRWYYFRSQDYSNVCVTDRPVGNE